MCDVMCTGIRIEYNCNSRNHPMNSFYALHQESRAQTMEAEWTLDQLAGYLATWYAVARYTAARGESPVPRFIERLKPLWGASHLTRRVRWPLQPAIGDHRRAR